MQNITTIGEYAFYECTSLPVENNLRYADAYLVGAVDKTQGTYKIKEGTKWIGNDAFNHCESLTSMVIPNSVTSIGKSAFSRCTSLTSVEIPNSVTSIGVWAFHGCESLTSVVIPNSVTTIGESAFRDCESLTSVVIPSSVTTIGNNAFNYCESLTSVVIPNSVTTIGESAFYECTSLTSVEIGNSVTTIGEYAFCKCTSLTSAVIPNSVTTIGTSAFSRCTSLTSVEIGNSVTTIGVWAFYGCSSLTSFSGKFASEDHRCLIVDGALNSFAPAGLTSYEIPNSVTSIGESAFSRCTSLTSVVIPNSVTTIGNEAFSGCSSLKEITSLAVTPPSIYDSDTFYGVSKTEAVVKVPAESLETYKTADYWKDFFNIIALTDEELKTLDISTTFADDFRTSGKAYNINGTEVNYDYRGFVIMNGKKVLRK